MTDLEEVRKLWLRERPQFEQFGREVVARLREGLLERGVWAEASCRAKDIDSLIRKLIKKPEHTYASIGDKCGVRLIVRYKHEVEEVLGLAAHLFDCSEPDQKVDKLRADQVGYLSAHLDVTLRANDPAATAFRPERFRAELQVRTLAQHLWSEMSHDTFYKNDETLNPLPNAIKRRIYILAGLVEVADNEFERLSSDVPASNEVYLLKCLERHYYKLTTRRADSDASLEVIRLLAPLYAQDAREIAVHLDRFYASHEETLRDVYEQAEGLADRSAYLYQPEALMIYERLESDLTETRRVWNERFPERELEHLANAFGISFD